MRITLTIILSFLAFSTFGQLSKLTGDITDEQGKALPSATIVLLSPEDSTMMYFGISNSEGHWEIKNIKSGDYLMQFAFLGFETAWREISFPYPEGEYWGIMAMKPKPVDLDGVEVIGEHVPMQIKKDTIEFNAKAFKTKPDAMVEDLLKKLPGIEVDRAGNVKAMGEDVRKVLVDGKEFFGNDPKVATKNLPADAVDKVQVFDKKSDEAEFTGIDDGTRDKALNLVLDEDKKDGVFGYLMGGYGTDNHYQGSAKLYRFTDKVQIAGLAMQNNINQFGFSFQDYMDFNGGMMAMMSGGSASVKIELDGNSPINFGQQVDGLTTSGAGGLNFSYSPAKDRRFFISYLGNATKKDLVQNTYTKNYTLDEPYEQNQDLERTSRDTTHNVNFGVRYRIDSTQNIFVDGGASLNFAKAWSTNYTDSYRNDQLVNWLDNIANQRSDRINGSASASWLKKFSGNRTVAKIAGNAGISKSMINQQWQNTTYFAMPDIEAIESLFQDDGIDNLSYSVNASLTQRLGKRFFTIPEFSYSSNNETLARTQGIPFPSDAIIDSLSPDFSRKLERFRPGITIKRSSDQLQLNLFLRTELYLTQNFLWDDDGVELSRFAFLPGFSMDYEYKTGRRINLNYKSNINQPTINQLLPIANTTNSLSVSYGNRNLKPELQQNIFAHWIIFDQFSFTSVFTSLNANYTKDKINWARTVNEDLSQRLDLVNVDDDYRISGRVDFSTPIRPLGINFKVGISESWNRGINPVNGVDNINTNLSHRFSLTLDNRTKKKWDVSVGGSFSLTDAKYSLKESLNNRYMNFGYWSDINWNPSDKWNFTVSADVTNYNDQSFGESLSVPLIGAEVSYFFMKNNRASFSLQGADLLNKNTGISRISELNYLRETRTNIIGRFVMLSFKYRLNKFGEGIVIKTHK
jgi:hypothetical protein